MVSHLARAKSLVLASLISIAAFLILGSIGCTTPKEKTEVSSPIAPVDTIKVPNGWTRLTSIGENWQAAYSEDGQRILYVSASRPNHPQPQIYEMTLSNRRERRLTFQDGFNADPAYHSNGQDFLYSSSTDEIKEDTSRMKKLFYREYENKTKSPTEILRLKKWLAWFEEPLEIYQSRLNGSAIRRLTSKAGFDGDMTLHSKAQKMVFSSRSNIGLDLYSMNLKDGSMAPLTRSEDWDVSPQLSPDGSSVAWLRFQEKNENSQIWIRSLKDQKTSAVAAPNGWIWTLSWTIDGKALLVAINYPDPSQWDLYWVDPHAQCWKQLTREKGNEIYPRQSPDGQSLLFTYDGTGHSHLYLAPFSVGQTCDFQGS